MGLMRTAPHLSLLMGDSLTNEILEPLVRIWSVIWDLLSFAVCDLYASFMSFAAGRHTALAWK